jgi:hypothetical protein
LLKLGGTVADSLAMRSAIGLCGTVGMFVGGYLPVMWGASSFSLTSIVFSAVGGAAGVWLGARLVNN